MHTHYTPYILHTTAHTHTYYTQHTLYNTHTNLIPDSLLDTINDAGSNRKKDANLPQWY